MEQVLAKLDEMSKKSQENKEAVEKKFDEASKEMKGEIKVVTDELDKVKGELGELKKGVGAIKLEKTGTKNFGQAFAEAIEENAGKIQRVSKGHGYEMEVKAVGNMTAANNLTGEAIATYQPGAVLKPGNLVNLRQIVGTFPSATGVYVNYRETTTEGGIGLTSAGGSKSQVDYDFARVVYTGVYISGYARIAKEMLQDLPFMQTVLPQLLLRDFYKKENSTFYDDWKAQASGGAAASGANEIEKLIHQIGQLENSDYNVNGIVLKPSVIAAIHNTKPSDYGMPGAVSRSADGSLSINGTPVFKASWAASTHMHMGDWSNARIGVVDGLKVEFFEQDSDNVTKNLITVRVEAREFLAIDDPAAFSYRAF